MIRTSHGPVSLGQRSAFASRSRPAGGFHSTTINSEERLCRFAWLIQASTKTCIRPNRLPPWSSFRAVTTTDR